MEDIKTTRNDETKAGKKREGEKEMWSVLDSVGNFFYRITNNNSNLGNNGFK
jgi:hypothetical protein